MLEDGHDLLDEVRKVWSKIWDRQTDIQGKVLSCSAAKHKALKKKIIKFKFIKTKRIHLLGSLSLPQIRDRGKE